jgi:hypothetical protein
MHLLAIPEYLTFANRVCDRIPVHPRVVGKSAGLPSGFVAKPGGWNKV